MKSVEDIDIPDFCDMLFRKFKGCFEYSKNNGCATLSDKSGCVYCDSAIIDSLIETGIIECRNGKCCIWWDENGIVESYVPEIVPKPKASNGPVLDDGKYPPYAKPDEFRNHPWPFWLKKGKRKKSKPNPNKCHVYFDDLAVRSRNRDGWYCKNTKILRHPDGRPRRLLQKNRHKKMRKGA